MESGKGRGEERPGHCGSLVDARTINQALAGSVVGVSALMGGRRTLWRAGSLGTPALPSVPGQERSRDARKQPPLLTLRIS